MLLLQAAMIGGMIVVAFFGLSLLIGIPIFTKIYLTLFRRFADGSELQTKFHPRIYDVLRITLSLLLAAFTTIVLLWIILTLLDKAFPDYGRFN